MCHSSRKEKAWIKVDLGANYRTESVVITNRKDCCQHRFDDHIVETSTDDVNWVQCFRGVLPHTAGAFTEKCAAEARYVRARMINPEYLNLQEIEVRGTPLCGVSRKPHLSKAAPASSATFVPGVYRCTTLLNQATGVFKSVPDWISSSQLGTLRDNGEQFRGKDGKFEFKITWDTGKAQHWKQTSNPMVHPGCTRNCGATGYEAIDISSTASKWGGLEYSGSSAVLDGSVNSDNWWYAVGSTRKFGAGLPASDHVATSVRFEVCTTS